MIEEPDITDYKILHINPIHTWQRSHDKNRIKPFGDMKPEDIPNALIEALKQKRGFFIKDNRQNKISNWIYMYRTENGGVVSVPVWVNSGQKTVFITTVEDVYKSEQQDWLVKQYNLIAKEKNVDLLSYMYDFK